MQGIRTVPLFGAIAALFVMSAGCDRSPFTPLDRRVTSAIEKGKYAETVRDVEDHLAKDPKNGKLLAERVFLYLASPSRDIKPAIISAEKNFEAGGGKRLDLLSVAAQSTIPAVRQNTAWLWGALKDPAGLGALQALAQEKDFNVRLAAIGAIGRIAQPSSQNLLLLILRDKSWEIRAAAAEALQNLKNPGALPNLLRSANDGDDYAKSKIREAIIALADPAYAELLRKKLKTGERSTKIAAALALGKLRDTASVPFLMELVQDPKFDDRPAAAQTLAAIGGDQAAPLFEKMLPVEKDKWVKLPIIKFFGARNDTQAARVLQEYRERVAAGEQDLF